MSEEKHKKKGVAIGVFVLLLILVGYAHSRYRALVAREMQAQIAISHAEEYDAVLRAYDALKTGIEEENGRCANFIAHEKGDFGSFAYCERFATWAHGLLEGGSSVIQ
jgi:effector-binding domain-containing protein